MDALGHHAASGELGDGGRRTRRRAERLERVAPRSVEDDEQYVRHGTIPSTNGTSKTFSCMTGPWPKKRSSPNSSPWSEVTITHVFDGSRSNRRLTTPSMWPTAPIWRRSASGRDWLSKTAGAGCSPSCSSRSLNTPCTPLIRGHLLDP